MEHTDRFEDDIDFDTLPIGRAELEAHLTLGAEIERNFLATQRQRPDAVPRDYAFVAMRKLRDQPFRVPIQRLYAT
jgi:hypothetical protein